MKIYTDYNDRILIPREDGNYRIVLNSEFIPAFFALPGEIVAHAEDAIWDLPHCPAELLLNPASVAVIESDKFLETIIDGYAYLIWDAMGMKNWMEYYSGYAPQWILAHETLLWLSRMQAKRILWTNKDLFAEPLLYQLIGFPSLEDAKNMVAAVAEEVLSVENRGEVIKVCNEIPCEEDFDEERTLNRKLEHFRREWYHQRTKHPMVSLDAILDAEKSGINQRLMRMESEEDMEDDVITKVDGEAFFRSLSETDQKILFLRNKGKTMEDVAKLVGLKTHSAVYKRIQKIGKAYELWSDEDLGFTHKEKKPVFDYSKIRQRKGVI
ncbi:MAG: hypothetical protein IJ138_07055 [Clostridia bacterium]|nr:hypothetical protein [Clostridia bacterium]